MKTYTTFVFTLLMLICFTGIGWGQAVVPGDIIITEFMADPDATSDSGGEYVELYNKRSVALNIDGFILKDDGSNSHTIDNAGTLNIPAESFIVLAVSGSPGFTPDYTYSSFTLTNSGDEIVLTDSKGTEIARVNYSSSSTGKSSELDALSSVNDQGQASGSSYSDSGSLIGNGDSGSPRSAGGTNLDENPTIRFSEHGSTVNESDGTIAIEVVLEDPDNNSVDVDVVFQQNISTSEGADFTSVATQTLSFGSGASDGATQNASFTLTNDSDYEGTEIAEFILNNISTSGDGKISGQTEFSLTIEDNDSPNVLINEIHADPHTSNGDADGDGIVTTDDDEFVEIVNNESVSVDIGGWTISDKDGVKHTFETGTVLIAGGAAVVFGSTGFSGSFGGSIVQGTTSVSLVNGGDTVTLKDDAGTTIDSYTYGSEGGDDQSLVRDPDITGNFVKHSTATSSGGSLFSPGTKIDGSLFTTSLVIEGNAGWRMLSSPVENMPISEITDDTPIQGYGDGYAKNFYDGYNGSSFTAPANLSGNLTSGKGFILYFYNNTDANSSTLPLVIDFGSNSEPSSNVNVSLHSAGNGWNLLGNPYQTAFDVTSIAPTGGSLASTVGQIWSDEDESYILTSANDDKIAPGQGFFLQNTDAVSVDLPTSGKATGTRFYKEVHQNAYVQLALISEGSDGEGIQKDLSTMLYFHEEATAEWDEWDAEKIYPLKSSYSLLNVVSNEGDKIKAQDSRLFEKGGIEIFHLDIEAQNVKPWHVIEWNNSSGIPDDWVFTFKDNKTGTETRMNEGFSYQFTYDDVTNSKTLSSTLAKSLTASKVSDDPRFMVVVNKGTASSIDLNDQPKEIKLQQNYPNPFNPTTHIEYSIVEMGEINISIYNVMGQRVETLISKAKSPGTYQVSWDASDMASGIYYYRLETGGQILTRKMILIK